MIINSQEMILNTVRLSHLDTEFNDGVLNITYGTDKNYLFGVGISMTSVLINNPDIKCVFHVFTDYMDDNFIKNSDQLALQFKTDIIIYHIDSNKLKLLPHTKTWSYATYFRFIAFDYLSSFFNMSLYLDSDVICKGSLSTIQRLHLSENEFAAVITDADFHQESAYQRLNIMALKGNYFNAGVVYANLIAWKNNAFMQKAIALLSDENNRHTLTFLDQDVLNILFVNHVVFLPKIFNTTYNLKNEISYKGSDIYKETINNETILIHYTAFTKPWYDWAFNYPSAQFFKVAYHQSPWNNSSLVAAKTPRQFKDRSKHEIAQGKWLKGIVSHIQYILVKLKQKL